MSISVSDPFVATRDRAMPSLVFALDPGVAQQHLERQLPRLAGEDGRVHLQAIRVTRHKPGRRCVIEYDVDVKRPDACLETVVLVGKVRAGRSGKNGYRLLDAFWKAGFQADSPDGISVPEPVGTVPEFQIWLQRKVPGRCAADLLAAPGGVALARKIAEAACKVHRTGVPARRRHTISDELNILKTRLLTVSPPGSPWAGRIARLLDAADRLGAATREPKTCGIHRDFYADQVIVDGERLFLLDFDLYCEGDPALDIGNFMGHITEQSLRTLGDAGALVDREQALEERFVELSGVAPAAVRAYATLTLVRHIYLSTQFLERRPFTQSLVELCEERLGVTRHLRSAESNPTAFKKVSLPDGLNGDARRRPRIALYSHDTQGLGHIRRNLLIARALCAGGESPVILLLSGVREAAAFPMPPGVDCVTLPSMGKGVDGRYFPRSLDVPMDDLIKVRSSGITAALRSFDPDVLIVDKVPRGIFDELLPGLGVLHARGRARTVLGFREVLDDAEAVRREWDEGDYESAIRAYYDRIWVYGDRSVYDTVTEYGFPEDIAQRVRFTGYLNPLDVADPDSKAERWDFDALLPEGGSRPLDLCLVGGGRDGLRLAEAFVHAMKPGIGVVVTGPLMPAESRARLRALASQHPRTHVLEFVTNPCLLLERADRVVAMAGYNTICEILAYRKPALLIPRTEPRTEQLIRAARFAALGLTDMLHPSDLTPEAISAWLTAKAARRSAPEEVMDFSGVRRLRGLLEEVLAAPDRGGETPHAVREGPRVGSILGSLEPLV
ncbi:MAG: hypothetical protein AUH74_07585 [Nitrospirae bacterium 13_1_40CM_4_62_6]|nr:MAG: hypothetical protein AUH74_07585 [Nitrospirae bacterium 13_1_40CM_4_62_6]OLD30137.1 MAG: hypothetical protein AUI49_09660 [Candidatus Rokubacteria bacterium 13_1_40CM_2_68_13]